GSQRAGIVRLVLESAAKLAIVGCAIGLVAAVAASGLLRSLLFGISPFDPITLTVAALAVLALAVVAAAPPAMRAASINPMQALRGE
ncbi:MAG: FtsX-like permease family protein, partial [Terracidiphilus sp.]